MMNLLDRPVVLFSLSFVALWVSARVGAGLRTKLRPLAEGERQDYDMVIAATLTLLGLLIGFTFSMATSRYDQRKNYEEEEANAIGTEYLRADLLPAEGATAIRKLLTKYVEQRILFYQTRDLGKLAQIDADTSEIENELWAVVRNAAAAHPTPPITLAVSGMNDVINSQGYTQAAWWNRIPIAAWILMAAIAVCCNMLIGYTAHGFRTLALWILPLAVSVSFLLIADIDSPRGGLIQLRPQNLTSLSQSLSQASPRP
jgi:hypothetical protein